MNETHDNRRKYRRAIFTFDDNIKAVFSVPSANAAPIITHILNIGEGGVHFVISPRDTERIQPGVKLVLLQLKGHEPLQYLVNIDAEVKWVLTHNILDHVGAGCEFLNLSDSSRLQIKSFVESWHEEDSKA